MTIKRTLAKVLARTTAFTARADNAGEPGDGLTLAGYAAVFNTPTRIDSWEGTFDERIREGAFKKTIRDSTPVMQFDHGRHPLIGSIPIGVYNSLSEDSEGLAVEGRLADNWLTQPVRDAIANKSITGMSFRFEVVRDQWTRGNGKVIKQTDDGFYDLLWAGEANDDGPLQRELIELKMPEAGPVVFPAYRETTVSVRAAQLAQAVMDDPDLIGEAQADLLGSYRSAIGVNIGGEVRHNVELPGDHALRRDLVRALLFGTRMEAGKTFLVGMPVRDDEEGFVAAPQNAVHPAADQTEAELTGNDPAEPDEVEEDDDEQDDAPADGHPSDEEDDDPTAGRSSGDNDAPPPGGHPSGATTQAERQALARRAYVTLNRVGKKYE